MKHHTGLNTASEMSEEATFPPSTTFPAGRAVSQKGVTNKRQLSDDRRSSYRKGEYLGRRAGGDDLSRHGELGTPHPAADHHLGMGGHRLVHQHRPLLG